MPIRFIVNPRSGRRRREDLAALIRAARLPGGDRPEIVETTGPGEATRLAREAAAAGYRLVVAVGGDGTVHECAQGLVGTETPLGLIPRGSGNGLARELGLPLRTVEALRVLECGRVWRVDVGQLGGRYFVSTFGLGLDAQIGLGFEQRAGHLRGQLPYFWIGLQEFLRFRPTPVRLRIDEEVRELAPLVLALANARQYGSGAMLAPRARMDDGWLDLVIVPLVGLPRATALTWRLFSGSLDRARGVESLRVQQVALTVPEGTPVQLDGEICVPGSSFEIRCLPASLSLWIP